MTDTNLAWHFLADREGQPVTRGGSVSVVAGQTLRVTPHRLQICGHGLHWSERAIDAIFYAPGPWVQRVRYGGNVLRSEDKGCSTERTTLWVADATRALHEFACDEADRGLALIPRPDPRSLAAVAVKRAWLRGEATKVDLAAAEAAAWKAAWEAMGKPAEMASRVATRVAVPVAILAAAETAEAAVWAATTGAVSRAAAEAIVETTKTAQNDRLTAALLTLRPIP